MTAAEQVGGQQLPIPTRSGASQIGPHLALSIRPRHSEADARFGEHVGGAPA